MATTVSAGNFNTIRNLSNFYEMSKIILFIQIFLTFQQDFLVYLTVPCKITIFI